MSTLIRSACLQGYVPLARAAGLDPYALMEEVGIRRSWLNEPDFRFSVLLFRELIQRSVEQSGWTDFGLRLARTRALSGLGPLALLVREQPTPRKAMEIMAAHIRLHVESLHLRLEDVDGTTLLLVSNNALSRHLRSPLVELIVGSLHQTIQQLLPDRVHPLSVNFMHLAPAGGSLSYQQFFGAPVRFSAECDALVYSSAVLDSPRSVDATLEAYARQLVGPLAAPRTDNLAEEVKGLVVSLLPQGRCSVQHIADLLALNERTLRRRLARDHTSYEQVLAQAREELALRYLETTRHSLAEIAELLGFSGGSRLAHWFRQRFGCTASQWRDRSGFSKRIGSQQTHPN